MIYDLSWDIFFHNCGPLKKYRFLSYNGLSISHALEYVFVLLNDLLFYIPPCLSVSICSLWTELPTSEEWGPRLAFIASQTNRSSPPWSVLIFNGHWNSPMACSKSACTVSALLSLTFKYVIMQVHPSMAPWSTNFHLMSLWLPSACQIKCGRGTQ